MTSTMQDPTILRGRTEAEAHVGVTCFKVGPPTLIGAELEWLVHDHHDPSVRPTLATTLAALGVHAPSSLVPGSPALPLRGGSTVTVEPGGQVELSSAPRPSAAHLVHDLVRDADQLADLLAAHGLQPRAAAADTTRAPERLLTLPRYRAMDDAFSARGPFGRLMMCNTAAVQVSVDAGRPGAEVRRRWALLHEAGPALLAAFACSPRLHGAPEGSWASQRMRSWFELDPARTVGPAVTGGDPAQEYAAWAVAVPLLCVRAGTGSWAAPAGATFLDWVEGRLDGVLERRPSVADLDYHLSTLFPPVRAGGHLEVRYLDAQPGRSWVAVVASLEALLSTPTVSTAARALVAGVRDRWHDAARDGLADGPLRRAATDLLELAAEHTPDPTLAAAVQRAARRTRAGLAPGQEQP